MTRLLVGAVVLRGACASPIVGAECRTGFTACDGECVDLQNDREHCGTCDTSCGLVETCIRGRCVMNGDDAGLLDGGALDADISDAAVDASTPRDGEVEGRDGSVADGSIPRDGDVRDGSARDGSVDRDGSVGDEDAGPTACSCDLGELCCGTTCVRPDRDRRHCGGCDMPCAADELCVLSTCEPLCEAPLELCGDVCVDLQTDPDHCGRCNRVCASGICIDGECAAGAVGHVVLVGHDYSSSRVGMRRVAGNAAFIARGAEIDVLVYEGDATTSAIRGVDRALDQVADELGRTWSRNVAASAEEVPLRLSEVDAFVVYSQSGATDETLRQLGRDWQLSMMTFLRRGGVVLVLDAGGDHAGTWQILDEAGLVDVDARASIDLEDLDVVDFGDPVASGVPLRYRAETSSVRFESDDDVVVVTHPLGPVVIHRTVTP